MPLDSIYTELITEHSRDKRNRRHVEGATCSHRGVNPSCGDELTLELRVQSGVIEDAAFTGSGCAISQASASMMTDLLRGRPVADANRIAEKFLGMIKGEITDEADLEELDEAAALQGVSKMPARVKCAVLPWHTYQQAIADPPGNPA
ncbi:MAG: SUF system NifU family Fe-S cluster assembly protein [Oscillospiraceae bacterium]|jgi:nitrogen fixation NifU-like protein|nr:SUF system NifU family Fe-S cluster assembly protein [Oscillospiraceae bacterium]